MAIFFTDLDNTLIYSYRRDIGRDKVCVELYQGREISFVTARTLELLKQVKAKCLLVPVTTRTQEQYSRIELKIGIPEYALVCNGGVLLKEGMEDANWYQESMDCVADCQEQLTQAQLLMGQDRNRNFEVRNIRKLFLFTKSQEPSKSVEFLRKNLDLERVGVYQIGVKVYVVPKRLNKGAAVKRLLVKLQEMGRKPEMVFAAGDSEFDVSMLQCADVPFAPESLHNSSVLPRQAAVAKEGQIFSEFVLEHVLKLH